MKVAISVVAAKSDAKLNARFGRAAAFVVVDSDTGERDVLPNPAQQARGGAGVQAAELLARHGVEAVISGKFGPKASDVLQAANIDMYLANSGTPEELVSKLMGGNLKKL